MIEALGLNNVQLLLQKYFKGEDLYPTIVGAEPNVEQSAVDIEKQKNFISWTSKLEGDYFKEGFSPYETYMSNDDFCGATSSEFDINNIAHRLCFNLRDNKVDFLTLFLLGCKEANIPFCFKFDKKAIRKDGVVIYVEQDKLADTVTVLQKIVDKFSEYAEKKDLPMSVVNGGWFGYAPSMPEDGGGSYNRKFTNCVKSAFFDVKLFNKYRHFFSMDNSLKDFSSVLFEQVKGEYILSGQPISTLEANEDALRKRFDDLSMLLALQFFSGDEKRGTGFVPAPDENGRVDISSPIKRIVNPETGFGVGITPTAVLKTALQLVRRGGMSFFSLSDDYGDFINALSNNIRDEMAKAGLSVAMPVELQGLAHSTTVTKNMDCYAM